MKFYAYIPRLDGSEPCGTINACLIELKTVKGVVKQAVRRLGTNKIIVKSYTNLYDDSTFKIVYDNWN